MAINNGGVTLDIAGQKINFQGASSIEVKPTNQGVTVSVGAKTQGSDSRGTAPNPTAPYANLTTNPLLATGNIGSSNLSNSSSPEAKVVSFFTSKGYAPHQAAAIAGNLKIESDFDLNSIGDGGQAKGLAQWHPDRQAKMKEVIGKDISQASFEEQLAFIDWELNNTEKEAGDAFKATKDVVEAASVFDEKYERSSGEHRDKRIAESQRTLSQFS